MEKRGIIENWLGVYGWRENPFKIKVSGDENLFVSLEEIKLNIIDRTTAGDIVNITGSTGIGKTEWASQLYQWFEKSGWVAVYVDLSGTEMNLESFLETIYNQLQLSMFARLLGKKATINMVLQRIKKLTEKKHVAIIIDEAQNITDRCVTDAIRRINDNCKDVSIMLFSIDDLTKNDAFRESIRRRMNIVSIRGMSLTESETLLMKRIRNAGGDELIPLSHELVEFIWRKSNKIPGLLLRYAEDVCIYNARGERLKTINPDLAVSVLGMSTTPGAGLRIEKPKVALEAKVVSEKPFLTPKMPATLQAKRVLEDLSSQQQTILFATKDAGVFTIEELATKLGMDYNVVRTQLNRINKKVGAEVFVLVKKVGKNKYWMLADNYRILFTTE